jgi:hypothetical protein
VTQRIEPVGPRTGVAPVDPVPPALLTPGERELERERRERRRREARAQRGGTPSEPAPERGGLDIRA